MPNKRWRILPHEPGKIEYLEKHAGVTSIVSQLLIARSISEPSVARVFLEAKLSGLRDPEDLPGVAEAADLIHQAVNERKRVIIYGDYDADGMTGSGILVGCLRLLGADVGYYIPNRLDEGYGLNAEALRKLAARGASMVISVDCGGTSVHEAEVARELGLSLIITDHHELGERLPDAAAVVHPRHPDGQYPFGGLCGAGVALKVAWALCQRASDAKKVSPAMREYLLRAVGLAAIGTVADVVPLVDENRVLVRHGLKSLYQRPVPGIAALMKVTGLDQKPALDAEDIAFMIAPRLNAAGRLGQAQLGVELLTTEDLDRAKALAEYIHELNSNRDTLERSVFLAANKQAKEEFDPTNDPALVLAGNGWHAGVIGIVAGRMAEKYHRPVVIISWDTVGAKPGVGSARSAAGLDLHRALLTCSEHLISSGGHAAAAGLKIAEPQLDAFRAAFCDHVAGRLSEEDRIAEVVIDAETQLSELTLPALNEIEQLAPFGQGNHRPVLCATDVRLAEPPRRIGGGQRHLSLKLKQYGVSMRAVGFGQGEAADALADVDGGIDIAFRPVINHYRGRRSVEMHLVDWRVSEPDDAAG